MTSSRDDNADRDTLYGSRDRMERVRATSSSARHTAAFDRPQATVSTAEIPVIRPTRQRMEPSRQFASRPGTPLNTWSARPDAAPAPVRLLVWTLLFILILLLIGFFTVLIHPTWLSFLRNTVPAPHALGALQAAGRLQALQ